MEFSGYGTVRPIHGVSEPDVQHNREIEGAWFVSGPAQVEVMEEMRRKAKWVIELIYTPTDCVLISKEIRNIMIFSPAENHCILFLLVDGNEAFGWKKALLSSSIVLFRFPKPALSWQVFTSS